MTREILKEIDRVSDGAAGGPSAAATWWDRYCAFGLAGLSGTARAVLENDSRAIARDCIPSPDVAAAWTETRVRTGVVVGAVQSGKTGSMLAIGALLLDAGVDVLVVLAGTRVALWKQTYERLLKQLDGTTPETSSERWAARVLAPHPLAALRGDDRTPPTAYMASAGSKIEQALQDRRPTVLVIPKVEAHLLAVSRELHQRIERALKKTPRRLHMVVMDDEADDASVLDAADSKTIPRRIEMLWSGKLYGQTANEKLYATYVAYTATPQANFLQQSHNPLAPRSFCAALRAPYKTGAALSAKRSPTFAEPEGITRYYCGGELFYNELPSGGDAAFCRPLRYPDPANAVDDAAHARQVRAASDAMLLDGLRAYLVGGGIRVLQARRAGKLLPSQLTAGVPSSQRRLILPPHCMLVHPSARQELHLDEARRLVAISAGRDPDTPWDDTPGDAAEPRLDVAALAESLRREPAEWRIWAARYGATLRTLATWPGAGDLIAPVEIDWEEIAASIVDEVLPHVRIRIINSDPASDDRPEFEPVDLGTGRIGSPPDLMTIFVSGNVMSRGITIEGLCTSVFTRPASEPAADTQMQMQRWFGYRGSHVHLCRVFTFDDQLTLFRMYHEHDVAMRNEILASMDRAELEAPNVVLQGPRSLATAKIPTSRLPLHPGPTPSVKLIEADDRAAAVTNADVLAAELQRGEWVAIGPSERPRGKLCVDPVPLEHVASILERFRYASYDPSLIDDVRFKRWKALEDHLQLLPTERPLFRPPAALTSTIEIDPRACPYSIAAYLRLWAAALKRSRCDGLYPSDSEGTSWALSQPLMRAPEFYVGVAYGEAGLSRWDQLAEHGVRAMKRGEAPGRPRMLNTLWGRRSEGGEYHGDQLFDYNYTKLSAPRLLGGTPLWRERGHPGLVLFHVIHVPDAEHDAVTVGLAIPHGGPEQFAALPAVVQKKS